MLNKAQWYRNTAERSFKLPSRDFGTITGHVFGKLGQLTRFDPKDNQLLDEPEQLDVLVLSGAHCLTQRFMNAMIEHDWHSKIQGRSLYVEHASDRLPRFVLIKYLFFHYQSC